MQAVTTIGLSLALDKCKAPCVLGSGVSSAESAFLSLSLNLGEQKDDGDEQPC